MMEMASAMYLPDFESNPNYSSANNDTDCYHQEMEDTEWFEQLPMDYFDGLDFQSLVSDSSNYQNPESVIIAPPPVTRPNISATTSRLISFEQSNNNNNAHPFYNNLGSNVKLETPNEEILLKFKSLSHQGANFKDINQRLTMTTNMAGAPVTRNPLQAQEYVVAERRRREKLNQKFIALSSIIPGLKKVDKASVLEGATEYVKQLKERQKILEEQVAMKRKEKARTSILYAGDNPSGEVSEQALAEMEARVLGKEVLIRIQCEQQRGCEAKILRELENVRLTVKSSSILPFGETTLHITIISQMEKENSVTANDLVRSLRKALTIYE